MATTRGESDPLVEIIISFGFPDKDRITGLWMIEPAKAKKFVDFAREVLGPPSRTDVEVVT